jgi:co-chaperonin GroES (HSP10)
MSTTTSYLRPLLGTLILHKDPLVTGQRVSGTDKILYYPSNELRDAQTARVVLHEPCDHDDLTGHRVVFTKWSGREFALRDSQGNLAYFNVIDERDVLAVIEEAE